MSVLISLLLIIFAPLFGVLIDRSGRKKQFVSWFALIAIGLTALMGFTAPLHLEALAVLPTAVLFFVFTLPLLLFYKEPRGTVQETRPLASGYKEIIHTFKDIRHHRPIFLFKIVYFFINDAIVMIAVYAKAIIGFTSEEFILLYLLSTFPSIIGSFAFGYTTRSAGARKSIFSDSFFLLL